MGRDRSPEDFQAHADCAAQDLRLAVRETEAVAGSQVRTSPELKEEPVLYYHEDTVTWTVPMQVPKDAQPGQYELAGAIGFQTCTPTAVRHAGRCRVPGASGGGPAAGQGYDPVERLRRAATTKVAKAAAAAAESAKSKSDATRRAAKRRTWSDKSLVTVLALAFLAGLILNVMPCVLPVIGLKIMSFVQQAGGSRREILSLNLWFSLGLLTVFWILAGAAVIRQPQLGGTFRQRRSSW